MKTTLNISEPVMRDLKCEAARQGRTMSEMVEGALRAYLKDSSRKTGLSPLPVFRSGGARVNLANREALYDIMAH